MSRSRVGEQQGVRQGPVSWPQVEQGATLIGERLVEAVVAQGSLSPAHEFLR